MITLTALMVAANQLLDADAAVVHADAQVALARETARVLREETLPNAMLELGLDSFQLDNGTHVALKQDVYASITKAQREAAFAWLVAHDFGGLIKTEVVVPFGKGQRDEAVALQATLPRAQLDETVHPSTLKAFVREQLADPDEFPMDLFGAWPIFTIKLT